MPLLDIYRVARDHSRDQRNALQANNSKLTHRLADVFLRTWDLGFTAFGGPPVHFKIIHQRFVEGQGGKAPWIDEQTYQELFALSQGLPGPGSTKLLFCTVLHHAGLVPALLVFLLWCLPGAIGMAALAVGVSRIKDQLPDPVYALLSGLNAATVGIIALAAVQLAENAIKDKLSRILVIFGACAGLCYNALWYFPVLMVIGGLTALVWDEWLQAVCLESVSRWRTRKSDKQVLVEEAPSSQGSESHELQTVPTSTKNEDVIERAEATCATVSSSTKFSTSEVDKDERRPTDDEIIADKKNLTKSQISSASNGHAIRVRIGIAIMIIFFRESPLTIWSFHTDRS